MAQTLSLNFRVGATARSAAESDPAFVGQRVVDALRERVEARGVERVMEAISAGQSQIVADIAADAARFGANTARVMTRIRSPASGSVSISLDSVARSAAVFSTDSASSRLRGKTTVEWLALTRRTIANKQRRARLARRGGRGSAGEPTTFFVDTGALRKVLLDHLGQAFALLVDPKILVRRGPRKVSVSLSIMAQASGREKAGVTDLNGGAIARQESMFARYLKRAGARDDPRHPLAYKLENPRGAHRPFLQNALAFWIANRLPAVLDASLKRALAARTKRGR